MRITFLPRPQPLDVGQHRQSSCIGLVRAAVKQPRILRHRGPFRNALRSEEVHRVPVIGTSSAFTAEVRANPARSEHNGALQLILILFGTRNGPPALFFIGDRTNELAVTVPAAFTDVDLTTFAQRLGTLFIPPPIVFRFAARRFSPCRTEGFGITSGKVLKLVSEIGVDQFLCRFLRITLIHQPGHYGIGNKREGKKTKPRDVQDS